MLFDILSLLSHLGFLSGSDSKESICSAGDLGSIPRLERSPGGGQGNPLQILAWRIPMDCNPPGSSVHGISQVRILEWVAISFSRGSLQSRDRACISWRRAWQSTLVFLPRESHGQRSLVGYSPWVADSWTQLSN